MGLIQILKYLALGGTVATGAFALIRPRAVQGFTGLSAPGPRGITELRAVLGGFFIALGVAPLILSAPAAYRMLGIAYLGVAVVRAVSMFIDRSIEQSNLISLAVEIVFGVILIL